jgi:hypothetical protein
MRPHTTLLLLVLAACSAADADQGEGTRAVAGDSIHAMPEMIARFQAQHAPVQGLGDGAPRSRAELIARFGAAVSAGDAAALRALTLTQADFAYLYFPTSPFSRPPYAQPPEIAWLLMEQNSLKGEARLLRQFGGRALDIAAHQCEDEPAVEGANRIWHECRLTLRHADGSTQPDVRLFGSILERDGRYALMSLANRL